MAITDRNWESAERPSKQDNDCMGVKGGNQEHLSEFKTAFTVTHKIKVIEWDKFEDSNTDNASINIRFTTQKVLSELNLQ